MIATRPGDQDGVLFRTDGGAIKGLSLGHVFRCLALARELRDRFAITPAFFMKEFEAGVRVVEDAGFDVVRLARDIDDKAAVGRILDRPERSIVYDLPNPSGSVFQRFAGADKHLVVIDDLNSFHEAATLTVNGNIAVPQNRPAEEPLSHRCYCGPAYAVLGREFDKPVERASECGAEKILVTCGGSDPAGLTAKIVRHLVDLDAAVQVTVVLGPGFGDDVTLHELTSETAARFDFCRNVDNLGDLMRAADLAIATAGRTAYELAATGTPAMLIPSIEHEAPVAQAFSEAGCAVTSSADTDADFSAALTRLMSDAELRASMSMNGPRVVDGQGRHRVARLIADDRSTGLETTEMSELAVK